MSQREGAGKTEHMVCWETKLRWGSEALASHSSSQFVSHLSVRSSFLSLVDRCYLICNWSQLIGHSYSNSLGMVTVRATRPIVDVTAGHNLISIQSPNHRECCTQQFEFCTFLPPPLTPLPHPQSFFAVLHKKWFLLQSYTERITVYAGVVGYLDIPMHDVLSVHVRKSRSQLEGGDNILKHGDRL